MSILDAILFACIAVALYAGFLSGWALGRRMPRAPDFLTSEEETARREQAWAEYWRRQRENDAAWERAHSASYDI